MFERSLCGWWAEIVTRFHSHLGGGVVLHNESTRSDVTSQLMKAGKNFFAPLLEQQSVRFLLFDPESGAVHRVEAKCDASGAIEVAQTEVLNYQINESLVGLLRAPQLAARYRRVCQAYAFLLWDFGYRLQ